MNHFIRPKNGKTSHAARITLSVIGLSVVGCSGTSPHSATDKSATEGPPKIARQPDNPLSLDDATEAVRQEIFRSKPNMNPAAQFPLRELTTPEIWNRLHVQVFMVTGSGYADESFLIDHGKTSLIGAGFGGHGIMSMCVTDLAQDGRPELVFTYSFGSGIHQSMVGMWSPGSAWVAADLTLQNDDLSLNKIDDHTIRLNYGEFHPDGHIFTSLGEFGAVRYVAGPGKSTIEIVPSPDLPDAIRKLIVR